MLSDTAKNKGTQGQQTRLMQGARINTDGCLRLVNQFETDPESESGLPIGIFMQSHAVNQWISRNKDKQGADPKKQRICPTRARYWSLVDVLPKSSEFARSAYKYIRNFKPVDLRFRSAAGHLCSQMDRVRPWSSSEKWGMVIYSQFRDRFGQILLVQEFKKPVLRL